MPHDYLVVPQRVVLMATLYARIPDKLHARLVALANERHATLAATAADVLSRGLVAPRRVWFLMHPDDRGQPIGPMLDEHSARRSAKAGYVLVGIYADVIEGAPA